ncbi:methylated-DNA--[protein]-cysteine S-methyltransferase [Luminiphilus sp.]|jgi:methylated-DNA-[protein]-cysteine S-methyltransferase|nr:methylated-DNA--[protein]-cysteine S-methyltransferase [Luminiphilus sp.]MDA8946518.1 methylated-DNA--[protein]-cysteine S-methyltransferase [Luminiphilus sp.]MDB2377317.1 methylated-DNA--[protein]-cysteine S-methyltransferase [Luminiphilus sp.]MDB2622753.1 methylated-DNA--[protein]-cysteine S-methyltransferase [Luminiphilus sp.]MDB2691052.1 methylated-DNA--[protein]-cysteine S-methyltransferase [Luminiphilus sp.]
MRQQLIATPIGTLQLVCEKGVLIEINWENEHRAAAEATHEDVELLALAAAEVTHFLNGERCRFTVPIEPRGTAFQASVWRQLRKIPWGETRSYHDIACSLDKPSASRAVGAAIGRNPLPLIIPCHRVIGSNGSLTGFAGGLAIKRQLLLIESHQRGLSFR